MRFEDFKLRAHAIRDRADKLNASVLDEARRLSVQAGLDPNLLGIHPHNAMCAYEAGKPWPGVDYALVRRIEWLLKEKQWEPVRLADRIVSRMLKQVRWGES